MAGRIFIDNTEVLIEAIKKRPALYLKSLQEYSNHEHKKKLWKEVCYDVVDGWLELSPVEKRNYCVEVQKKWQNLRTCFIRELKAQMKYSGKSASKRRRKYIYFDKLIFLKSSVKPVFEENDAVTNDSSSDSGEERQDSIDIERAKENDITERKSGIKKGKPVNDFQECNIINTVIDDLDEDRNFALSLVPSLKSLSYEEKLEAKISILQVFQSINSKRMLKSEPISYE